MLAVALLVAGLAAAHAQWNTVCPQATGGPYSEWNQTRCDSATSTCCTSGFSVTNAGCVPLVNAVCCPNGYAACPENTFCVPISGSGYATVYNCTVSAEETDGSLGYSVCKPGPALPMSQTLKNVVWIGDSLSIGMAPFLASSVADIAFVQHSPWDTSDGGAEETTYGLRCLPYFLASPSGIAITPDLILFNWGMHDGPLGNTTVPGQNAPPTNYTVELTLIVEALLQFNASVGAKLAFVATTPFLCSNASNGCVQTLNNEAVAIMEQYGIPVVSAYNAIVQQCGGVPVQSCFGQSQCFCPHCPAGYSWVVDNVMEPFVRDILAE